jgi:hypothetical protein
MIRGYKFVLTPEAEASLQNVEEFSRYLKENSALHLYKNQLVNDV